MRNPDIGKLEKLLRLTGGNFKAFLYDCDGKQADYRHLHKAAYVKAAASYNIDLSETLIDELAGMPTFLIAKEIARRYDARLDPGCLAAGKMCIYKSECVDKTMPIPFMIEHLKRSKDNVKIGVVSGGCRSAVTKTLEKLLE